jgi:hypothetical protein
MTRQNNSEFGRAQSIKSVIRAGFDEIDPSVKDGYMNNRLAVKVLELMKKDPVSKRGERQLLPENLEQLKGFELNQEAELENIISLKYDTNIDKETGLINVFVKPFVPKETFKVHPPAPLFRFVAGAMCMSLETWDLEHSTDSSGMWAVDGEDALGFELRISLPMKIKGAILVTLCLQFADLRDGNTYGCSYTHRNAARIIEIKN